MVVLYDTHAHLSHREFQADVNGVVERAEAAGISRLICVGIDLASSEAAIRLSEQHPSVFAVVGCHPNHALEAPDDLRPALLKLSAHPKVVGIGEAGLDYYRLPNQKPGASEEAAGFKKRQAEILEQQLEVAAQRGLNIVIHQRGDVFEDTCALLRPWAGRVRPVFHCFPGDPAALRRILDLGGLVSFTGILTFKNGQNMREALAAAPMDAFMLETDCPYLAPMPHRGKRCEPAYLKETAEAAALVKGCSLDELGAATCATAHGFFKGLA